LRHTKNHNNNTTLNIATKARTIPIIGGGGGGAGDDDFSVTAFVCVVEALADVVDSEDELA